MDSSGKCEGMLDCPFKGTMGSIAGTRVRSSRVVGRRDRKSTRLNSSHSQISYAVFCLKKKNYNTVEIPTTVLANTGGRIHPLPHTSPYCQSVSMPLL